MKDQAGDTTGFIGLIRDISKRMQAESQLKAEKEWSERLINYAPNIVVGLQEGSKIAVFNRFAERLTGYKAEEVIGKEWIGTFIPEELRGDIYQAWEDIVDNQLIDHHFENEIITKSGERRLIEWSNTIITENGEFQMILSLGVDITERVHAEQALRESEEKYRTLVNSTLQGVVIARSDPVRLVFANPAMAQISGYPPERLIEIGPDELAKLIYEEDRQRFFANFQKRIQGENIPQANEYRIVTNDGTVKWVALYSSQIQYRNEPATLTTFMDITARKQAEERLEEYTDQLEDMVAERAQELRDAQDKLIRQERLAALGQIAGSMSHELRNPLGVIHNASYYLKMKLADADEDIQESIEMIDEETQNASKIIADLLDFGRTQAADPALVNVSEVVNAVIERNPPPGDVTLHVDVPENLPPVFVDELQLKQVLTNLVTNAYQAMPEGGAVVGGEWAADSGQRPD